MKIIKQATDEAILAELGGRLAKIRLDRNLTQAELATQAGVSKRTVERLETGAVATQLSGFIRVCRVLEVIERFELLVPEPVPSPVAQLKLAGGNASGHPLPNRTNPPGQNGNGGRTCRDYSRGSPESGGPVAGFCGTGRGNQRMALANSGPSAIEFAARISILRMCGFNSQQHPATDSTMKT